MTPELLIGSITLFVLSIFLGFELITKVPAMLHTPLMSGANAISGISVVGALIGANVAYEGGDTLVSGLLDLLPAPLSTKISKPFFINFLTEPGTIATLFSPSGSNKTPNFIIPHLQIQA